MATSYTHNACLQKPATSDRYWDIPLNANADFLDSLSSIGALIVSPTEIPSATLNVRVSAGSYIKGDGTVASFPGATSYPLGASQSLQLWLTDSGVLSSGTSFPTTAHVRLATVVTGVSSIQSIQDARVVAQSAGSGLGFVLKSGDTVAGTLSIVSPTTGTTSFIVNPSTLSIGFFGATPATQAASVAPLVDNSTGTAGSSIVDVGPTHSQSTLDNNFATLAAKVNALIATMKRHGLMAN